MFCTHIFNPGTSPARKTSKTESTASRAAGGDKRTAPPETRRRHTRARGGSPRGRNQARPVRPRDRHRLARRLRRTARQRPSRDPIRRRYELLLTDRVIAVRAELLEIAAALDQCDEPNAEAVDAAYNLLTHGYDSPLYNADVHPSELRATLYYVRASLARDRDDRVEPSYPQPAAKVRRRRDREAL